MARNSSSNNGRPPRKGKRPVRKGNCANCGCDETQTRLWRSNPEDPKNPNNMLCNACGLWVKEKRTKRPPGYPRRKAKCRDPKGLTRKPKPSTDDEDELGGEWDGPISSTADKNQGTAGQANTHSKVNTSASAPTATTAAAVTATAGKTRKPRARATKPKPTPKAKAPASAPVPAPDHTPAAAPAPAMAPSPAPPPRLPTPEPEVEKVTAPATEASDAEDIFAAASTLLAFDPRNASALTPSSPSPAKKRSHAEYDDQHNQYDDRQRTLPRFSALERPYNPAWMGDIHRTAGSHSAAPTTRASRSKGARYAHESPTSYRTPQHTHHGGQYTTPPHSQRHAGYKTPDTATQAYDNGASSYPTPQSVMDTPDLRARTLEESPVMNTADWFFSGGGPPPLASSPPPMALPESEYNRNHNRYEAYPYSPERAHQPIHAAHQSAHNGARYHNYFDYELL